ncbi:MAG: hypothetical protein ACYDH5_15655 [Acidimicrobiales bacterium]
MSYSAGPFQRPGDLVGGLRAAFAVTALGACFVLSDPAEDLLEAVPVPAWCLRALRIALALPVLALGGVGQLVLAGPMPSLSTSGSRGRATTHSPGPGSPSSWSVSPPSPTGPQPWSTAGTGATWVGHSPRHSGLA